MAKLFEKIDDNPGEYFGMLAEGFENERNLLKEDSEYKTLAKLSNGLEVISYPYGYAVSDGHRIDRFIVTGDIFLMDDKTTFSRLSDKDKGKILSLIKKGVIKESLKESVSKSDLYSALEYMYGFNKKEANDWMKKASDKMKQSVVDGWKGNAKKSALTDSLKKDDYEQFMIDMGRDIINGKKSGDGWKLSIRNPKYCTDGDLEEIADMVLDPQEQGTTSNGIQWRIKIDKSLLEDKFVSRDKMSKKDRKELDSQKRNTWGSTNPVTRVQPNKKAYDRKRDKKELDENIEGIDLTEEQLKTINITLNRMRDTSIMLKNDINNGYISKKDFRNTIWFFENATKSLKALLK